jgi:hypothetical protein
MSYISGWTGFVKFRPESIIDNRARGKKVGVSGKDGEEVHRRMPAFFSSGEGQWHEKPVWIEGLDFFLARRGV